MIDFFDLSDQLKQSLENLQKEKENLELDIRSLKSSQSELKKIKDQLKNEVSELFEAKSQAIKAVNQKEVQFAVYRERTLKQLETDSKNLNVKKDDLEQEKKKFEIAKTNWQSNRDWQNKLLDDKSNLLADQEQTLKLAQENLIKQETDYQEKLESLKEQITQLNVKETGLKTLIIKGEEIAKLVRKNEKQESDLATRGSNLNTQELVLKSELEKINRLKFELLAKLKAVNKKEEELKVKEIRLEDREQTLRINLKV